MYRDFIFNFSDGRHLAFEMAVKKYAASLTAFAFSLIGNEQGAEDTVQEVFLALWVNKPRFNDEEHLKRSLYTSVRNRSYNNLRSSVRLKKLMDKTEHESVPDDPMLMMMKQEVIMQLLGMIETLPDRMAEVLRLTLRGYRQEEIAELMGIAVSSVKTMKKKGIGKIRSRYK